MTDKTAVSTRQIFYLALPLLLIMGHFFLVPVYLDWAGRDAWVGILAGFAAGGVLFAAMGRLQERLYGRTLVEWAILRWGPTVGRLATLPYIAYMFALSVITLYGTGVFVGSVFFVERPLWVITGTFTLVLLYLVHHGIEVIARVCEWVLLYNIVSGLLVSLALHHMKDYTKLTPVLRHGMAPVLPVMLLVLAVFGEMLVLLMVHVKREGPRSFSHTRMYMILFAAAMIILPSTTVGPVVIFGEEQARELAFPVESTVRLINVGFIERFDIYGLTIMTVSALLRLALLHYASSTAVAQWFSLPSHKPVNLLLGAVLLAVSHTTFSDYSELLVFLRRLYPYGGAAGVVILAMGLWTFSKRSNRGT
ncbi:GerAB/ArcD/ProY family transporter [Gorillibacterium sp. sgz5001074]|uniref:GerAB/ArcD/ProY family transporter n=1 Tax=Gorillibacterium sp. sgz5001074 TaxID=3446695 RepID=UPI003F6657E0